MRLGFEPFLVHLQMPDMLIQYVKMLTLFASQVTLKSMNTTIVN